MAWNGVRARFATFHANLFLTVPQHQEGESHYHGVCKSLNSHYYEDNSETANSLLVGSWGKQLRTRPPRDIDVYFQLPIAVYNKYEGRTGNKQSQLLQEVKGVLEKTYPSTNIKGDGPVVVVGFNRMSVEVVPAFKLTNGQFFICITKNGGSYKTADPHAEINQVSAVDYECSENLRPLAMMVKAWQSHCNVPLKSFYLELLMAEFILGSPYKHRNYFWYDWLIRDFFLFLVNRINGMVTVPGTLESISLGDTWESKAKSAAANAISACVNEQADYIYLAGGDWQKIFGEQIPVSA